MRGILAVTLQSMQNDMKRVDVVGANLANATTSGYKREMVIERPFVELMMQTASTAQNASTDESHPLMAQVMTDTRAGMLKATGQKLDLALGGNGYFEIQTNDGIAYTRQGNLQLDARGRLVTAQGYPVLGKAGEIFLKTSNPIIDENGNIRDGSLDHQGTATTDKVLAQIKVMTMKDSRALRKIGDGLIVANEQAEWTEASSPMIKQGHLENSNVSSMEEMVQLMQAMRHFESMQKVTQGYDEMLGTAIRKLGDI
ncbi:flagellar hook-basal body protein [Undibacterium flavidum]|uniref:Flagellar hook-basal body protein n=1 Tax=Undibacterium flavidum TaxID=2762297 RepID=A0ABR6YET0_9BURK|nr:flagellar hook-basal body protein [Undibacterium flavidum]MBC3875069.1 flagellar hook-basal body protein [Undibacterium flavidum]